MKITKKDIFFIHILLLINIINCNLKRPLFKCEHSIEDEMNPLPNYVDENPIKDKGEQKRRINMLIIKLMKKVSEILIFT